MGDGLLARARLGLGEDARGLLPLVVSQVTETYLAASADARNAIETGFLEHVFERADLVPLFESWRLNPELSEAYELCLAWGRAHRRS